MASTSFQRKNGPGRPKIRGTKTDGQEVLISTGVASLDECIGGGLAVGSLILIEEDVGNIYSQLLIKYFIADGISHDHQIILYPGDVPYEVTLKNIPTAVEKTKTPVFPDAALNEPLKIAWRYQQVQSVPSLSGFQSRTFDWNQPVTKEKLSQITCYEGKPTYAGVLSHLANKLSSHNPNNKVLRFVIQDLGSPVWEDEESSLKFLYCVRCLCRTYNTTCLITTPRYWMQQELGRSCRVRSLADVVLQLHTLHEHEKETHTHLKNYDGFLYFHRVCRPNSLFTRCVNKTRDLAFSVKRKMFIIEKIHLPPVFNEDPVIKTTPVSMCSSRPGTSALDF